jgi:hypothetical protein
LSDYELGELLCTGYRPNDLQIGNLRGVLSRLYAYDLFVGNHDRHLENFLMSIDYADEKSTRTGYLQAIDFDSADIVTRTEIRLPMVPSSNTMKAARRIRQAHQFDNQQADDLLTRLVKGREFMFEQAMYGLPKEWLSDTDRLALLDRVRSERFERQIRQLQQGLGNGSYL